MMARLSIFALAAALSTACTSGAPQSAQEMFNSQSLLLAAALVDNPSKLKEMIREVRLMDFQSGATKVSDLDAFRAARKNFDHRRMEFRGTDTLILMDAVIGKPGHQCRDQLSVWFNPAGDKLDVTYSINGDAVCANPINAADPAPTGSR